MKSLYQEAKEAIKPMKIGDLVTIDKPENVAYYRKFLNEIAAREGKKFTTKTVGDKLHIVRVEYFNIINKINE
jgi:hypothetical protein